MMKKLICCFLLVVFVHSLLSCSLFETHELYTTDISNYDSEEYPIDVCGFLFKELPENAEVLSFSYYDYWNEDVDIYLELKFEHQDELLNYIIMLKVCQT